MLQLVVQLLMLVVGILVLLVLRRFDLDTIDLVDVDKVARSARLVFNTAWLLANDDERPPPPSASH